MLLHAALNSMSIFCSTRQAEAGSILLSILLIVGRSIRMFWLVSFSGEMIYDSASPDGAI
jgi:hypothetical protein